MQMEHLCLHWQPQVSSCPARRRWLPPWLPLRRARRPLCNSSSSTKAAAARLQQRPTHNSPHRDSQQRCRTLRQWGGVAAPAGAGAPGGARKRAAEEAPEVQGDQSRRKRADTRADAGLGTEKPAALSEVAGERHAPAPPASSAAAISSLVSTLEQEVCASILKLMHIGVPVQCWCSGALTASAQPLW